MAARKKTHYKKILAAVWGYQLSAVLATLVTLPVIRAGWYNELRGSRSMPINSLFGPVLSILSLLMSISLYIVWTAEVKNAKRRRDIQATLHLFVLQLCLNFCWPLVFFGFRMPAFGIVVICALWITVAMLIARAWRVSAFAGLLLLPYLGWISYAALLNLYIVLLN